ncbi:hypothetical protein CEXT_199331 [Caerostris extrusa]|uniref:Uncharacterized protein n=1 Tax=Caerostris extrusa TaxID=172846 RepID=A0AAV4WUX9_CAEEX|nr:hypothetical protein CEXT_199331 [Caerostris extrusa]
MEGNWWGRENAPGKIKKKKRKEKEVLAASNAKWRNHPSSFGECFPSLISLVFQNIWLRRVIFSFAQVTKTNPFRGVFVFSLQIEFDRFGKEGVGGRAGGGKGCNSTIWRGQVKKGGPNPLVPTGVEPPQQKWGGPNDLRKEDGNRISCSGQVRMPLVRSFPQRGGLIDLFIGGVGGRVRVRV